MRKASKIASFLLLGAMLTATVISCKSKEGAADGTADSTMVDTTMPPPPPPAQDVPADTTTTPADSTAMPAK
ncbi:MAG: hypothetical protein EOO50_01455 [Flavobacterium sp.]|uniref:hypothetical protein n=1 Tax=Flavobacterium sp. TaxID=239 RepID=UPI00120E2C84|nr:hypothetical protein [Flavobacterium sp.]RZJ68485.1 MAG: hypothetical protein EOO50_01455 [Flavobacterium sp.]